MNYYFLSIVLLVVMCLLLSISIAINSFYCIKHRITVLKIQKWQLTKPIEVDIKNHTYYYLDNLIDINYLNFEKLK